MSVYTRNVEYNSENTRTFTALGQSLAYLRETIFPLLFQEGKSKEQTEQVSVFIEERLIAIRCEYFVQGIICPA